MRSPTLTGLTLIRVAWTNLTRDRVAQALTFLLPIIFFSIFATVFGRRADPQTTRIRVAVVDEDRIRIQPPGRRGAAEGERLASPDRRRVKRRPAPTLDRAGAERLVRSGDVPGRVS